MKLRISIDGNLDLVLILVLNAVAFLLVVTMICDVDFAVAARTRMRIR